MNRYDVRVYSADIELREADGDSPAELRGLAIPYGVQSRLLGDMWGPGFYEIIERGAAKDALDGPPDDDVQAFRNHDYDAILARTGAGSLTLKETRDGVTFRMELRADTQVARDTIADVRAGNLSQMSFGFNVPTEGASWSMADEERELRTVKLIDPLYEISVVTSAAYGDATDVAERSAKRVWTERSARKASDYSYARARARAQRFRFHTGERYA